MTFLAKCENAQVAIGGWSAGRRDSGDGRPWSRGESSARTSGRHTRHSFETLDEEQIDLRYGLVDLLKTGKLQTKKRRPITPLCPTLRGWLIHWDARHPEIWNGGPIREINDAFRSIVRPMGLAQFIPYTIRHFCSSEAIARGATDPDRSRMLGHLPKAAAATSAWNAHRTVANYLKSAVDTTE